MRYFRTREEQAQKGEGAAVPLDLPLTAVNTDSGPGPITALGRADQHFHHMQEVNGNKRLEEKKSQYGASCNIDILLRSGERNKEFVYYLAN